MDNQTNLLAASQTVVQSERRPYAPPRLIVHGTLATVTGAVGGTDTDKVGGSQLT